MQLHDVFSIIKRIVFNLVVWIFTIWFRAMTQFRASNSMFATATVFWAPSFTATFYKVCYRFRSWRNFATDRIIKATLIYIPTKLVYWMQGHNVFDRIFPYHRNIMRSQHMKKDLRRLWLQVNFLLEPHDSNTRTNVTRILLDTYYVYIEHKQIVPEHLVAMLFQGYPMHLKFRHHI